MRKILLALGFLTALVGCSSIPVDTKIADIVPASRIALPNYVIRSAGTREIIIKRDSSFRTIGADTRFYINGNRVANIGNAEVLRIYLKDGRYKIGVKTYGFDDSENPIQEIAIRVGDEEDSIYRIFFGRSGFTIQPSSF